MITERNYLDVYTYDSWRANNIPIFQDGQTFVPSSLMMQESVTVAPAVRSVAE